MRVFKLTLFSLLLLTTSLSFAQTGTGHNPVDYSLVYKPTGYDRVSVKKDVAFTSDGVTLKMNVYYPPDFKEGETRPTVVFVNGVGDPPGLPDDQRVRNWGQYTSWPRAAASQGFVSLMFDTRQGTVAEDIQRGFTYLHEKGKDHGVDGNAMAAWACSANVSTTLPFLMSENAKGIKCGVMYYGHNPVASIRTDLPILYIRAGLDSANLNNGIRELWSRAMSSNAPWTMLNVPNSIHAFDCFEETQESVDAIKKTLAFFVEQLRPVRHNLAPPSKVRTAFIYWFSQRWDKAAEAYREVLKDNPSDSIAELRLGTSLVNSRQLSEGEEVLAKLVAKEPGNVQALLNLSAAKQQTNKPDEAKALLERVLAADPNFAEAHSRLGLMAMTRQDYQGAQKHFENAHRLAPNHGGYLSYLGTNELYLNRNQDAATHLKRATELFPAPGAFYNLACAHARLGQKDEAFAALGRSVDLGYRNKTELEGDSDLAGLKSDPRFQQLLSRLT